jgi:hypothetical protein
MDFMSLSGARLSTVGEGGVFGSSKALELLHADFAHVLRSFTNSVDGKFMWVRVDSAEGSDSTVSSLTTDAGVPTPLSLTASTSTSCATTGVAGVPNESGACDLGFVRFAVEKNDKMDCSEPPWNDLLRFVVFMVIDGGLISVVWLETALGRV